MKCRACNAHISDLKITTQTPTCPHCGAFWPGGLAPLWVIALLAVAFGLYVLMLLS